MDIDPSILSDLDNLRKHTNDNNQGKAEKDPSGGVNTAAAAGGEYDVEELLLYADLLKKQLNKAKTEFSQHAQNMKGLEALRTERDRYRATVLSLAYQNKKFNEELNRSRKGISTKEERYIDAKMQVADLREALALKELEVEELKAARDYMPTSDADLLLAYKRMREVFESLKAKLACTLCYETYRPNDVTTLECGHTMCQKCLQTWSNTNFRLYNLVTTPDCPECRAPGRHFVKVYVLEEVVRTVDRLDRLEAEHEAMKQAERKVELEAQQMAKATRMVKEEMDLEEEVDELASPPPEPPVQT